MRQLYGMRVRALPGISVHIDRLDCFDSLHKLGKINIFHAARIVQDPVNGSSIVKVVGKAGFDQVITVNPELCADKLRLMLQVPP